MTVAVNAGGFFDGYFVVVMRQKPSDPAACLELEMPQWRRLRVSGSTPYFLAILAYTSFSSGFKASIAASVASIGCILVILWVVEVDQIFGVGGRK